MLWPMVARIVEMWWAPKIRRLIVAGKVLRWLSDGRRTHQLLLLILIEYVWIGLLLCARTSERSRNVWPIAHDTHLLIHYGLRREANVWRLQMMRQHRIWRASMMMRCRMRRWLLMIGRVRRLM